MHDPEELLTENSEVAARLDLAGYLLRCTSNVVIITADGGLTAAAVARHLALALAGSAEIAGAIIDAATAHNRDRLAERLLLDEGTEPGTAAVAEQLAGRLQARRLGLAVIIEDAHGLPPALLKELIDLSRQVSQRDATMPVALICPEAEAHYLAGIAQEAGRATEQIQRVTLIPTAEQPPRRRRWAGTAVWLAVPALAAVGGILALPWIGSPWNPDSDPTATEARATDPEPAGAAAGAASADRDVTRSRTDRPAVSLPPEIAAASVFATATIPTLPQPLRTAGAPTPAGPTARGDDNAQASTEGHTSAAPPEAGDIVVEGAQSDGQTELDDTAGAVAGEADIPETVPVGAPQSSDEPAVHADEGPAERTGPDLAATRDPGANATNAADPATGADETPAGGSPHGDGDPEAGVSDRQWLATRTAGHYTVQMIAGRQQDTTRRFIDAHPGVRDRVRVVTVDGDDGIWHLVLFGEFASRAEAMRNLPKGFAPGDVYARRFGSIRGE
ncbi:SPOR domain-containing protein [Arhodomonas sp. SL1]|uniref:SPOR domain-containing protein n=1 Tax=Arhodomonas sp. SL1 TaxID=3425691 RepID=UPI003F881D90